MHLYALALGSNRRHGRHGPPPAVLAAAARALGEIGEVRAVSPVIATPALGPAGRAFANAALVLRSALDPPALLAALKRIERGFGRRRGRRWGPRVLDLDIALWSGGRWRGRALCIPHASLPGRRFVLDPLASVAGNWPVPGTGARVRHLRARLTGGAPLHRDGRGGSVAQSVERATFNR